METECSLPQSQAPITCPYTEPHQFSPLPDSTSWISPLILSSNLHLGLQSGLFPSSFPTKIVYAPFLFPIRAACPTYLILLLFTRIIFGEEWSRYMPGVAQRVGRGIALLFHDRGTRRGWVFSSTPRPHFTPGKYPVSILQEAGWAPGPVWTGGKSRPHRDSIPGPSNP